MKNTKPARFNFLTVASVISALAVVIMHTNSFWAYAPGFRWEIANIINCLCVFAVPIFFMISGSTLIDYSDRYDTKTFFKKRLKKTLIPFIFWSLIAVLIHATYLKDLPTSSYEPIRMTFSIINTTIVPIYWFFPVLFCIYLCMPLFTATKKSTRQATFRYLIFASLIINSFLPFIIKLFKLPGSLPIAVTVTTNSLYYVFVGYYISHYDISGRKRAIIYALGFIALLAAIIGTSINTNQSGIVNGFWRGLDKPTYTLYAPAVFLAIKQLTARFQLAKHRLTVKFFTFFSRYTFALYLLHWFFLAFLDRWIKPSLHAFVYLPVASLIVVVASILFTATIRKIPFLRAVLPD